VNLARLSLAAALVAVTIGAGAAHAQTAPAPAKVWKHTFSAGGGSRLGVQIESMSDQLRAYFGAPKESGVLIGSVEAGSPAEKSGLRAGDVIVDVDGTAVDRPGDVIHAVSAKKESEVATIGVIRDKHRLTFVAAVRGPQPESFGALPSHGFGASADDFDRAWSFLGADSVHKLEQRLSELEKRLGELEKKTR
jgi:membrane-associated protease RseP (regulator of RpoE activity)